MRRNIDGQTAFAYTRKRLSELVGGLRREGGFLPPERVVCEEFGISRDTLKSAIDSLVKERLVEVRPRKGNYVLKATPLDFRAGLLLGTEAMPFLGDVRASLLAAALEVFAKTPLTGLHQLQVQDLEKLPEIVRQYSLDGILWIDPEPEHAAAFGRLLKGKLRVSAALGSFRDIKLPGNYAALDHKASGRSKAAHLADRGCRRIAYAFVEVGNNGHEGFREELAKRGLALKPELVLSCAKEVQERLPKLLKEGLIDGLASEGGFGLVDSILEVFRERRASPIETVVDFMPMQSLKLEGIDPRAFHLNVLPIKGIGRTAAKALLATKGTPPGRIEPVLLEPKVLQAAKLLQDDGRLRECSCVAKEVEAL